MSNISYEFDGLSKLEKQLMEMSEQKFPKEFEQLVIQIAYELQGRAKQRTPHITGRLQDSWKVGKITKKNGEYYIEVYTNVDYAEPVEYGHRTRGGGSFVPGVHMMEISVAEVSQRLPAFLREWLDNFISTHSL